MTSNQLINANGDHCTGCGQQFLRNLVGFDTLPLVEFVPTPGIPFKRVMDCLRMDPPDEGLQTAARNNKGGAGW